MGAEHSFVERYRAVWEVSLQKRDLAADDVAKSQFYFEQDLTTPTPRRFDTYGVAALLPMPAAAQELFSGLWEEILDLLGRPLAYGVAPENRHVELILFSRPEEVFAEDVIQRSVAASYAKIAANPPKSFQVEFRYPFITPDGTVVGPGYPIPEATIEDFRGAVREVAPSIPAQQSRWLHTSLGRILEPVSADRFRRALDALESRWGDAVVTCQIDELVWTHEKQWYMVEKDVLHRLRLAEGPTDASHVPKI